MNSIYHQAIKTYQEEPENLVNILNRITDGVFQQIEESAEFTASEKATVAMYVVYAYSKESAYVVFGATSLSIKESVANVVGLPDYLRQKVMLLGSSDVRSCLLAYLEYQADRDYQHLETKRRIYEETQRASAHDVTDETSGKTNYKLLVELQGLGDKLLDEIIALEDKLMQKYDFINPNKMDVQESAERSGKPPASLSMEASPTVKQHYNAPQHPMIARR